MGQAKLTHFNLDQYFMNLTRLIWRTIQASPSGKTRVVMKVQDLYAFQIKFNNFKCDSEVINSIYL